MLTLYILRHAKACQNQPGLKDIDRPLQAVGRAEANEIGDYMQRTVSSPQAILGSSARRVRETLDLLLPYFDSDISVHLESALYLASVEKLMEKISTVKSNTCRVLIIGHNPVITNFATLLACDSDQNKLHQLGSGFPTATLAELRFDQDEWSKIEKTKGRLIRLKLPTKI